MTSNKIKRMLIAVTPYDDDADQNQQGADRNIERDGFIQKQSSVKDGDDVAQAEQWMQHGQFAETESRGHQDCTHAVQHEAAEHVQIQDGV